MTSRPGATLAGMPSKYEELIQKLEKHMSEERARTNTVGSFVANLPQNIVNYWGASETLINRFDFRHPDRGGQSVEPREAIRRDKHRTYSTLLGLSLTIDKQTASFSFETTIVVNESGTLRVSFDGHGTEVNPRTTDGYPRLSEMLLFAIDLKIATMY